ncbi:hypothetical protein S-CBP2_0006 [Synechococcus phage S-CBP2]|uniref:Uncharacterized protein n=1 Tax=Synechococcus phage S-CBP2 TaxID=756277 RepID=A0A096VL05_9CAUD|nr:hypothetical protein S-CBP2_0006 [Synechococcus phage S-CBP2]AGF91123.1 hypothetical protein SXHG_00101 [Synechococcus phage MRHenn-2013a]AGK86712.1 hypothetical protein S-CBP2_0006 [Synechococcus phage S-CBP2]
MIDTFRSRTFRSDYGTSSEYAELVLSLQPHLHRGYVEPNPTNWGTLHPLAKLAIRIAWLSGAGPILTLGVLISGPKAFKYFDIRNVINN